MKRDWDLVKAILLYVGAQPAGRHIERMIVNGAEPAAVAEHAEFLIRTGFLHGTVSKAAGAAHLHIKGLSRQGEDFLYRALDDAAWSRAMRAAGEAGPSMMIEDFAHLLRAVSHRPFS